MNGLRRFLRAGRAEQLLILRVSLLVAGIRAALWMFPFRWIRNGLLQCPARLRQQYVPMDIHCVVRAVRGVSRRIPKATCLTQAIATRILLSRMGMPSELKLGVARNPDTGCFEAHAWIEYEGRVIIGGTLPGRYVPLPDLEGVTG